MTETQSASEHRRTRVLRVLAVGLVATVVVAALGLLALPVGLRVQMPVGKTRAYLMAVGLGTHASPGERSLADPTWAGTGAACSPRAQGSSSSLRPARRCAPC